MNSSNNWAFLANVLIVHHNWKVERQERSENGFVCSFLLPWGGRYNWSTDTLKDDTLEGLYNEYRSIVSEFVDESDEHFPAISLEDFTRFHRHLGYPFLFSPLSKQQVTIVVKALIKALGWKVVKVRPEGNIFNRIDFRPKGSYHGYAWFCKEVYYWEQLYKVYIDCRDNRCRDYPVVRDIREGEFYEFVKESLHGHY